MPALGVSSVLAWALFAFGGYYDWAVIPLIIGTAIVAVLSGVRLAASEPDARLLDRALVAVVACTALQLLPLPYALLSRLDPAAVAFLSVYRLDFPMQLASGGPLPHPISIAPARTALRLGLVASAILLFWVVRRIAEDGGERRIVRSIAWMGLVVSLVMIVQRAAAGDRLYGVWEPPPHVAPRGPILNRNHFATWMLLALPLAAGYMMARIERYRRERRSTLDAIVRSIDVRQVWLLAAAAVMTLAALMSESRSGAVGLVSAAAAALVLGVGRLDWAGRALAAAYLVALLGAALSWANIGILAARFERTTSERDFRLEIWRETVPVVRDFWLTGAGLGTYSTVMILYQQSQRDVYFNHAHNQYLQLAAEGGLLLTVPFGVALVALVRLARTRLREDRTPVFWIRVGAAAGAVGLAVQSIWETGIRTPANMMLFAAVSALLVAAPRGAPDEAVE